MTRRPSLIELEALRATIAEGSTAGAARRLHRAQSSISRALAQLEAQLGYPLFERVGRGMRPTAEALALDRKLEAVFSALDGLTVPPDAPPLTIIAPPSFGHALLPEALARLRAGRDGGGVAGGPALSLILAPSDQVLSTVAEGQADLGMTDTIALHPGVNLTPFRLSHAVCALPADHPLTAHASLSPTDLRGYPHIAISRRHAMRAELDRFFANFGIDRPISVETSSLIGALGCVRAGLGLCVMNPFPLLRTPPIGIAVRPLTPAPRYQTYFVTGPAPLAPAARRLLQILKRLTHTDPWSDAA